MEQSNKKSHDASRSKGLPQSIVVAQEDPHRYVRETIDSIFSDKFMAFLALLLVPIIIAEFFVKLSPSEYDFLEICDWMIIALFVIEYISKLYLSENKWAHFTARWHLLDLVIVVVPFVQLLPFLGLKLTGSASLLLRLLRLPRVFAAAGRAASARSANSTVVVEPTVEPQTVIRKVDASSLSTNPQASATSLTWEELRAELSNKNQAWIDICNISEGGFQKLGEIMQISELHFKSGLLDEIFPHIDSHKEASFIFLQSGKLTFPQSSSDHLTLSRSGFILICKGTKLISVSMHDINLLGRVSFGDLDKLKAGSSFLVSVLYKILESLLSERRRLLSEIEIDVIRIGNIPRSNLPRDFLERIYQLTKEVSRVNSNLVHLKDLIGILMSREIPLIGFGLDSEEAFQVLQDEASYLNEIADGLVENLKSIIELYINQESFETNRVLKILAVITSVAVIPAAVSGLLGMNLLGIPFHAYLWEVVFVIGISVSFAIYAFVKLGWLKT